jgi:hypothetical protein
MAKSLGIDKAAPQISFKHMSFAEIFIALSTLTSLMETTSRASHLSTNLVVFSDSLCETIENHIECIRTQLLGRNLNDAADTAMRDQLLSLADHALRLSSLGADNHFGRASNG